jgi:hypothetical protein
VHAPGPLLATKLPRRNVSLIVEILAIRFYSRAAKTGRAEFRSMPSTGQSKFPLKLFADADHSFHVGVISGHFADEDVTQPETADVAGPPQAFDDLRGTLRNFELKVGVAGTAKFEARIR